MTHSLGSMPAEAIQTKTHKQTSRVEQEDTKPPGLVFPINKKKTKSKATTIRKSERLAAANADAAAAAPNAAPAAAAAAPAAASPTANRYRRTPTPGHDS